jgi:hypothetical protein
MEKPSDRNETEAMLAALFAGNDPDNVDDDYDDLVLGISEMLMGDDPPPVDHFGDPPTPPQIADYLIAWARDNS